jgi:NAD(P)-dependent dehydrogenase (short-subunit alcohol dehydrogenase family)
LIEQTEAEYDRTMNVNVKGVWLSMKHEIAQMLKQGSGSIVNTASAVGVVAFPSLPLYTASKHAVVGLTKAAALQYAKAGIRINVVAPAVIETDMFEAATGGQDEVELTWQDFTRSDGLEHRLKLQMQSCFYHLTWHRS